MSLKVLHILYQSIPNISGSSTRSYDIVTSQLNTGEMEPFVVTSPFQNGIETSNGTEKIDGIVYYRTGSNLEFDGINESKKSFSQKWKKLFTIFSFYKRLKNIVDQTKPDILHAHAMFFVAIPTIIIGKRRKIPVVYEIRSLWEERRKNFGFISKLEAGVLKKIETYCMRKADVVIAINENLRDNIETRLSKTSQTYVVNNAVNMQFIASIKSKSKVPKSKLPRFGYIGSISKIEGLSGLLDLFKNELKEYTLHIYGSGERNEVELLNKKAVGFSNIRLHGSINRNDIYRAYDEIDVIVNPRVNLPITNSVTPLKPLEAMAFEKIVVASDVGGMKELITHNENGFLFKSEDYSDLLKKINLVIELDTTEKERIIRNGISHVLNNRSWTKNAEIYLDIYKSMIK